MSKMLSNSICFILNNAKGIRSFENRIKVFEYSKMAITSSGLIFLQETTPPHLMKKNVTMSIKENSFSHTVKATLVKLLLASNCHW